MITLLDYRRKVGDLYRLIRENRTDSPHTYQSFKSTRDDLFGLHPQSPLDANQKSSFKGLRYFAYDPAFRVVVTPKPIENPQVYTVDVGDDGAFKMRQFAEVNINLPTGTGTLGVFWIEGYGGGVFIPFRDESNGTETYGGGRYILDTIKGADLGVTEDGALILDFNYAYHPSCYYNPRWVCPLAPPQNHLSFPVPTGEMLMTADK
ncbi:MAG: DUF1684 domain-containing protein [Aggregatilineales bacterium]